MKNSPELDGVVEALEDDSTPSAKVDALMAIGLSRTLIARAVGVNYKTISRWYDGSQDNSGSQSPQRANLNALGESMRILISNGLPPPNARA